MSTEDFLDNDLSDIKEYINTVKLEKFSVDNPFDSLSGEAEEVSEKAVPETKEFKLPSYIPAYIPPEYQNEESSEDIEAENTEADGIEAENTETDNIEVDNTEADDFSSEIPVDVDTMGVVIDSAPSLNTESIEQNEIDAIDENDINDLMANLMSSIDSVDDGTKENVPEAQGDLYNSVDDQFISGMDPETIEAGKALEEYLNTPVETLINHPQMPASFNFDIPSVDEFEDSTFGSNAAIDDLSFPSLPQAPEIPEIVNSIADTENIAITDNVDVTENTERLDNTEIINNIEPDDSTEILDNVELSDNTEVFDNIKNTDNTDNTEASSVTMEVDLSALEEEKTVNIMNSLETDSDIDEIRKELALASDDEDDLPDENDIEKMLARAQQSEDKSTEALNDMSLEELLETSNTGETDQISSLLEKAERNEAVDEGIAALLSGGDDLPPIKLGEDGIDDEAQIDPKQAKKLEKQRLKEEKKEAKRKAKEAKLAAKKAKKEAKNGDVIEKLSFDDSDISDAENSNKEIGTNDMSDIDALLTDADSLSVEAGNAVPDAEAVSDQDIVNAINNAEFEASDSSDNEEAMALAGLFSADGDSDFDSDGETGDSLGEDIEAESFEADAEHNDSKADEAQSDELKDNEKSGKDKKKKAKKSKKSDASDEVADLENMPEKGEGKTNPFKAFFGKIVEFITEEDDEDDEKSEIILSDENAAILDELNGEQGKGKKKKKKKNAKAKASEDEDGESAPEKKPKKKKKEKKPKVKDENEKPEPKISKKKISMVALVCIMLAAAIYITTYFTADYTVKKSGRDAYMNEDYQTCYQNLYGKKLSDSEEIMYNQSECILKINLWLREYEMFVEDMQETKALDSLIQSVNAYPTLRNSADQWGCLDKVETVYEKMRQILKGKYNLSTEDAVAIAAEEDDVVYTRLVTAVASGVNYADALNYIITDDISGNQPIDGAEAVEENTPANMEDMLPEEDGINNNSYVEP